MSKIKSAIEFWKQSAYRKTMIKATFLSFFYRLEIKFIKPKYLEKRWGKRDQVTDDSMPKEWYYTARCISYAVNRTCNHTPWESKCLVRAWTAQTLLKHKKIPSTLYLGCGTDETGKMVAHAWIRVGTMYVTGGDGEGYGVVSTFVA